MSQRKFQSNHQKWKIRTPKCCRCRRNGQRQAPNVYKILIDLANARFPGPMPCKKLMGERLHFQNMQIWQKYSVLSPNCCQGHRKQGIAGEHVFCYPSNYLWFDPHGNIWMPEIFFFWSFTLKPCGIALKETGLILDWTQWNMVTEKPMGSQYSSPGFGKEIKASSLAGRALGGEHESYWRLLIKI